MVWRLWWYMGLWRQEEYRSSRWGKSGIVVVSEMFVCRKMEQ